MSFHKNVTIEQLYKAQLRNPKGVQRLAKFVCSIDLQPRNIWEACQLQRLTQVLATRGQNRRRQ